jgi:putative phage-type endonuclease
MTAVELLAPADATPANPRWHELRAAGVSASEIAQVLGISPWGSAFSLYWQKLNGWSVDLSAEMEWGSRLEAAIVTKFQDEHSGDLVVRRAGLYASKERPWQVATPDGLVCEDKICGRCDIDVVDECTCYDDLVALLECKTAHSTERWGEPGTDDIPVYYRAQALWQMDVLGVDTVHVPVLIDGVDYREYVVRRDEKDLRAMRLAGEAFMGRLENGDPPDLDGHEATIRTLKTLHPDLEDREQEVAPDIAQAWREARERKAAAEADERRYEAELRAAMGPARRGTVAGEKVVTRVVSDIAERTQTVAAHRRDYLLAPRGKK